MPVCFVIDCGWKFSCFSTLMSHYKYRHRLKPTGCEIICKEGSCFRSFSSFRSIKDHFKRCHPLADSSDSISMPNVNEPIIQENEEDELLSNVSALVSELEDSVRDAVHDEELAELLSVEQFQDYVKWEAANMLQTLYNEDVIPRNKVQLVTDLVTNLFSSFVDFLKVNLPKGVVLNNTAITVSEVLAPLRTPFLDLETEYKRFKYFSELGSFIPPKPFLIGETSETVIENGVQKSVIVKHEGHYISLKKVLYQFLSTNSALLKILNYMNNLKNEKDIIFNFVQAEHWQNKRYGKLVIPLSVYSDSYEVGNSLSSHHGIHKLTAVYVSILPLPPEFRGDLSNIFLSMLFHSSDHKNFGNKAVFQVLLDELKLLFSEGILFNMPEFSGTVYFTAELALGDHLDINGKLGMVENFTANFPCRICKIHIDDLKFQTQTLTVTLRDRQNYKEDLALKNTKLTGIKEECVFHQLPYFFLTENVASDPLHDILEGVAKYDFVAILQDLVYVKNFFTLEILNHAIKNFDYGAVDRNIPPLITNEELKGDKIRMTGSEMLTFCQFFGLFVGHFVFEGDRSWQLYIALRHILDITFSSFLQDGLENLLQEYVWEHNALYLSFPGATEKFKFHMLTHYPLLLKKYGPPKNIACPRFEAKHQPSIKAAKSVASRRNISRTLTIKNQLKFHQHLQSKEVLKDKLIFGPDSHLAQRIDQYGQVMMSIPRLYHSFRWVKFKGTLFKPKMCVITDFFDNLPHFACIREILTLENNSVAFICQRLKTICFNNHYFAYAIEMSDEFSLVTVDSLAIPLPTSITKDFRGDLHITYIGC